MSGRRLKVCLRAAVLAIGSLIIALPTHALSPAQMEMYAQNNILFYDPQGDECDYSATGPSISSPVAGSGYERLKDAVRQYGEVAMEMQREWGTPWEIVFAQMQKESSTGTAGYAVQGADNNWLGITGSGDAGYWENSSGRKWAVYTSVEASIKAWAGTSVLRNGYYDDAFPFLDPNNYNLQQFLVEMISHYAPSSDGNNEVAYVSDVLSFVNGPIREAQEEMGWPSSAELARQENIPVGGRHPIGSEPSGGGGVNTENSSSSACINRSNGDINQTAILFSWPDRSHAMTDPKPEYAATFNQPGGVATVNVDECFMGGYSCDAFVGTVMRFSGADPNFPFFLGGAANRTDGQWTYLPAHPELYEEIPNIGDASNMQPGDIRISPGHIEMYIVLDDGSGRIASASHCDRTADHAPNYYANDYRIFRRK